MNKFFNQYKELLAYLIVGILTTIVSLGSYYICVHTFLNPHNPIQLQWANIISWIAAVTFAYFTNRRFVFDSQNTHILKEAVHFYLSRITTLLLDMAFMYVCVSLLKINDFTAKISVQILITIANYPISKFYVFKS